MNLMKSKPSLIVRIDIWPGNESEPICAPPEPNTAHTCKSNSESAVVYASYGKSEAHSLYRAITSSIHTVKHWSLLMFFERSSLRYKFAASQQPVLTVGCSSREWLLKVIRGIHLVLLLRRDIIWIDNRLCIRVFYSAKACRWPRMWPALS